MSKSSQLFLASSVADNRLALEQNGNIRLLTLVTIVYLPLTLATVRHLLISKYRRSLTASSPFTG